MQEQINSIVSGIKTSGLDLLRFLNPLEYAKNYLGLFKIALRSARDFPSKKLIALNLAMLLIYCTSIAGRQYMFRSTAEQACEKWEGCPPNFISENFRILFLATLLLQAPAFIQDSWSRRNGAMEFFSRIKRWCLGSEEERSTLIRAIMRSSAARSRPSSYREICAKNLNGIIFFTSNTGINFLAGWIGAFLVSREASNYIGESAYSLVGIIEIMEVFRIAEMICNEDGPYQKPFVQLPYGVTRKQLALYYTSMTSSAAWKALVNLTTILGFSSAVIEIFDSEMEISFQTLSFPEKAGAITLGILSLYSNGLEAHQNFANQIFRKEEGSDYNLAKTNDELRLNRVMLCAVTTGNLLSSVAAIRTLEFDQKNESIYTAVLCLLGFSTAFTHPKVWKDYEQFRSERVWSESAPWVSIDVGRTASPTPESENLEGASSPREQSTTQTQQISGTPAIESEVRPLIASSQTSTLRKNTKLNISSTFFKKPNGKTSYHSMDSSAPSLVVSP